MPVITLSTVPGFSDLSDAPLAANKIALGVHLSRINVNAAFGMVRLEVFNGIYGDGDTVPLPTSAVDGYTYSRNELIYMWVPQNTANRTTGWASNREPWTMWYGVWSVDQTTGNVSSEIGYRGNNDHKDRQAVTNDGVLQVFVIAQRQKTGLIMAAAPTFNKHLDADFYTDRKLNQSLVQDLNHGAKFGVANTEVIYMGEFFNGQTVPQPVSPIDGRTYAYSEVKFQTSWRWTADSDGSGNPQKPAISKGQLQDWSASVGAGGGVTVTQTAYELNGQHTYTTGKIAVFAFCSRPAGTTFSTVQTAFAELADSVFSSGSTLRASSVQQLNKNINQGVCTPEFFGPTTYVNGNNIALPTSPLDGYTYARSELTYIWDWANTGPSANATGRLSLVHGSIDASGNVTVNDYRLNSGASAASLVHEGQMRVIIMAKRSTSTTQSFSNISPPDIAGDPITDFFGYIPGQLGDNLVTNGDFTQGGVNWGPAASWGGTSSVSFLNAVSGLPRGSSELKTPATADKNQEAIEFIPVDLSKTYFIEGWIKIPASISANGCYGGIQEYDLNKSPIAHLSGVNGSSWCLWNNIPTTVGNTWQYFAAEVTGNGGATPAGFGTFNSGTRYIRPVFLFNWNGGAPAQAIELTGVRISEVAGGATRALRLLQLGISSDLNKQGSIAPGQSFTIAFTFNDTSINLSWSSQTILRADNTTITISAGTQNYTSLTALTKYYIYGYLNMATNAVGFSNGSPPPSGSSGNSTMATQAALDGRFALSPVVITTLTTGGTGGSGTGGDGGTCPEENELTIIETKGLMRAEEVLVGQYILGYSFAQKKDVYRRVSGISYQSCPAWSIVNGFRVTPCEPVNLDLDPTKWIPAFRAPGATFDELVSYKMNIVVDADEFDEHNYWIAREDGTRMLIHNPVLPRC